VTVEQYIAGDSHAVLVYALVILGLQGGLHEGDVLKVERHRRA
jgi:hypothetical protein